MTNWKSEVAAAVIAHPSVVRGAQISPDHELANALALVLKAGTLAGSDATFAASLMSGFAKYGSFTDKQRPHVARLAGTQATTATEPSPDATLAAALRAALPYVGERSEGFARSLLSGFDKFGSFTDRQRPYAQSLANCFPASLLEAPEKAQVTSSARPATPVATPPVVAQQPQAPATLCPNLVATVSLDRFSRFTVGELQVAVKNDGSVLFVRYAGLFAGTIDPVSKVYCESRRFLSPDALARGKAALVEVEKDPMEAAKANGILTGRCSCCGRPLTDPTSISIGIGPICLAKF